MVKRIISIALSCLLLTAAVSCSQDNSNLAIEPGAKYVALGSSFAAGPGIAEQLGGCGRSDHNYSHLIADELGLTLNNVSCNGATIANILDTPQGDAAAQIEAVTSDTALVTVTIGGNDINYTSSTFACSGKASEEACAANLDQPTIDAAVSQLPSRLALMLDTVKAKAPRATVVLVTYPRVFPEDARTCSELELSGDDIDYLAGLGEKLEAAFVSASSSREVLIADAYVSEAGHGPCAASDRWVNGATTQEDGIRYHPTGRGHAEMARLVLAVLSENSL